MFEVDNFFCEKVLCVDVKLYLVIWIIKKVDERYVLNWKSISCELCVLELIF